MPETGMNLIIEITSQTYRQGLVFERSNNVDVNSIDNAITSGMSGIEIVLQNGVCSPLVALLSSSTVDAICQKNLLTFADMLAPFCNVQISIKVERNLIFKPR